MPHDQGTIFISANYKKPLSKFTISDKFIKCLKKANLAKNYTHPNFRDTFETICKISGNGIRNSCDAVLGHKQGIQGNYIAPEAYIKISADACEAVRNYYFADCKIIQN